MLTFGEVAAARRGSNPPQDVMRLSASWEIMCVTLTTYTWFSLEFTKSITVLELLLQKNTQHVKNALKTLKKKGLINSKPPVST